jgi:hypothetical protein
LSLCQIFRGTSHLLSAVLYIDRRFLDFEQRVPNSGHGLVEIPAQLFQVTLEWRVYRIGKIALSQVFHARSKLLHGKIDLFGTFPAP